MPPPIAGGYKSTNEIYRNLTDMLNTYYAGREDVVILGNYMSTGLDSGAKREQASQPTENRPVYSTQINIIRS